MYFYYMYVVTTLYDCQNLRHTVFSLPIPGCALLSAGMSHHTVPFPVRPGLRSTLCRNATSYCVLPCLFRAALYSLPECPSHCALPVHPELCAASCRNCFHAMTFLSAPDACLTDAEILSPHSSSHPLRIVCHAVQGQCGFPR